MKKKTIKKKKEDGLADVYTVSVRILGKVYSTQAPSVLEALSSLSVGRARGTTVMTVTHGATTKERILPVMATNRLFNSAGLTRSVALKNTSLLFDGL